MRKAAKIWALFLLASVVLSPPWHKIKGHLQERGLVQHCALTFCSSQSAGMGGPKFEGSLGVGLGDTKAYMRRTLGALLDSEITRVLKC